MRNLTSLFLAVLLLGMFTPGTSLAIVADKFICHVRITSLIDHKQVDQDFEGFAARWPLSASPAPDIRLTAAEIKNELKLETRFYSVTAGFKLYYKHGFKVNSNVNPRQYTCLAMSNLQYCSGGACIVSGSLCADIIDPFDPLAGWPEVGMVDGEPAFDINSLNPVSTIIPTPHGRDGAKFEVSCQFLGTYR